MKLELQAALLPAANLLKALRDGAPATTCNFIDTSTELTRVKPTVI